MYKIKPVDLRDKSNNAALQVVPLIVQQLNEAIEGLNSLAEQVGRLSEIVDALEARNKPESES